MPITTAAYQHDKTIIIYTFTGDWTWEEFYEADTAISQECLKNRQRVDLILDFSNCKEIPNGINDILHRVGKRESGDGGLGILIDAPLSLQVIVRALKRIYTHKSRVYEFVDSFDEAIAMIYNNRQTSPPENV